MSQNPDIAFLNSQLQKLQKHYDTLQELCPQDLLPTGDSSPRTSEDEERCARLANQYGFNDSLFRNLFSSSPREDCMDWDSYLKKIHRQIETIPRIIAAIESAAEECQTPTIAPEKLSRHYSPKELTRLFGYSWDTLKKRLDEGKIRNIKHTTKDYQIHLDDLESANR